MKFILTLVFILLYSSQAQTQTDPGFAPVGATWSMGWQNFINPSEGYCYTYTSDRDTTVLVNGQSQTYRILHNSGAYLCAVRDEFPGKTYFTHNFRDEYLYMDNTLGLGDTMTIVLLDVEHHLPQDTAYFKVTQLQEAFWLGRARKIWAYTNTAEPSIHFGPFIDGIGSSTSFFPYSDLDESIYTLFQYSYGTDTVDFQTQACRLTGTETPVPAAAARLYPNPATTRLHLDGINGEICIMNTHGAVLYTGPAPADGLSIGHLAPGIYLLRTAAGQAVSFVKEE